ncbi:hypothetical protein Bpfe_016440 [Biomphalaria pfeifferi]|uniref:Uncharacterized protein n=1 Tax=Biomphalaria pfeifferi TaxID=112525 RepID=A0AAD8BHP4_BIOPF|nr:hypothetical protein Bpfe_016440 [Biomphalaria pfeifferi]
MPFRRHSRMSYSVELQARGAILLTYRPKVPFSRPTDQMSHPVAPHAKVAIRLTYRPEHVQDPHTRVTPGQDLACPPAPSGAPSAPFEVFPALFAQGPVSRLRRKSYTSQRPREMASFAKPQT